MRRLAWLVGLGLAACGNPGPDEGAVLTFEAPDGMAADRVEVLLANAAADATADLDNQRREPGSDDGAGDVRYLRQRARGGVIEGMTGLGGFTLRIEADAATSTDEQFIPIVLVYAGDALVGIGAVEDGAGDPSAVQIAPGVLTSYAVTVTPVAVDDGADDALAAGHARFVACAGRLQDPPWRSGLAWVAHARQLRLLLPDTSQDPMATDATARPLDLDCDAHAADAADCDDLRAAFYSGAPESCDGLDTNCDTARYFPEPCAQSAVACDVGGNAMNGVAICDDDDGMATSCQPSAQCLCGATQSNPTCTRCLVTFTGTANAKTACSPSVGQLTLPMCDNTACAVEVAGATPSWRAYVGTTEIGPFTTKLPAVHTVFLEVKRSGTAAQSTGSIGEAYLLVTPATTGVAVTLPVQLEMAQGSDGCIAIAGGSGSKMTCTP